MKIKRHYLSGLILLFFVLFSCMTQGATPTNYLVTTIPSPSNLVDGARTNARFYMPYNVTVDQIGNVYVADTKNHAIRKITSDGVVTTLAGNGKYGFVNGVGTNASFAWPDGIAVDKLGNVYVADGNNQVIRKITSSGVVTTFAGNSTQGFVDGNSAKASFYWPCGVAVDGVGNIYVADSGNNAIRKIDTNRIVTTLAGNGNWGFANGSGTNATFSGPEGVAVDRSGNIYVADNANNTIRKITSNGIVTTLAGRGGWENSFSNGVGANATFLSPSGVAVDESGNVYVADAGNNAIRKITSNGIVTTLAGNGSYGFSNDTGTNATFNVPFGVAVDASGNVYVADNANNAIRKITGDGIVTTLAGGVALPGFACPEGLAIDKSNNIYTVDLYNNVIRQIDTNQNIKTITSQPTYGYANPEDIAIDKSGNIYIADVGKNMIRTITSNGLAATFAGNGTFGFSNGNSANASFYGPGGIALDKSANLYVSDYGNEAIRKISSNGLVTTLAGNGKMGFANGTGAKATFNGPEGVVVDGIGNIFVAESYNHAIRKISSNGVVTTIAGNGKGGFTDGTGTNATFNGPEGVAVDGIGNIYVADQYNHAIRKISSNGVVTTIAGKGKEGFADGTGTNATFNQPFRVVVDSSGNIYVTDSLNNALRKLTPLYAKASNPITFVQPSTRTYSNGTTFALAATAPGGIVTFTSGNTNVITISGSTATIKGAGSSVITANQAGNSNYLAATPVVKTVTVNKAGQTITFNPTSPVAIATTKSFTLSGSSTSGLPLTYTSSATNVISISGSTATVKTKGVTSLKASQAGDANYNTATEVSKSVTVQ